MTSLAIFFFVEFKPVVRICYFFKFDNIKSSLKKLIIVFLVLEGVIFFYMRMIVLVIISNFRSVSVILS